jgi:hypothetical protein
VSTDVTDSVQPIFLEPEARGLLINALQPWLLTMTPLTLVLLAGEKPSTSENASSNERWSKLDEIEQVALMGVRRTDMVVRCCSSCCALVLLDTKVEGAHCVVNRLRKCLKTPATRRRPLLMGVATAPEHATDSEALIDQACKSSSSLLLLEEQGNATGNGTTQMEWPDMPFTPQRWGVFRRSSSATIRRFNSAMSKSAEPGHNVELRRTAQGSGGSGPAALFVQARALALGVPYLAPPQSIPTSVRNLLPPEVMEHLQCLPVGRERNVLTVALADPTDREVLRRLEQMTGMTIFPVMTDPDVLKSLARPARSRHTSQPVSTSTTRAHR